MGFGSSSRIAVVRLLLLLLLLLLIQCPAPSSAFSPPLPSTPSNSTQMGIEEICKSLEQKAKINKIFKEVVESFANYILEDDIIVGRVKSKKEEAFVFLTYMHTYLYYSTLCLSAFQTKTLSRSWAVPSI